MKKVISVILAAALIFALAGCSLFKEKEDISGKYTLSSVMSIKNTDDSKVRISYTMTLKGSAEDVAKIKKHEVVLSEEAEELLVEKGEETQELNDDNLVIKGTMTFNSGSKSIEEIYDSSFIQGLKITDSDGNEGSFNS